MPLSKAAANEVVQGCQPAQYLDGSSVGFDRTLPWNLSIGTSPLRCLRVAVGQAVTWDGNLAVHPLDPAGGDLPNPIAGVPDTGVVQFTAPGTFGYVCGVHPSMKGAIHVVGATPVTVPAAASVVGPALLLLVLVLVGSGALVLRRRSA